MSLARGTLTVNNGSGSGTAVSAAAGSFTSGRLAVVSVTWEDSGALTSVTDTAGNTYVLGTAAIDGSSQSRSRMAYCLNMTGHASNVVTANFDVAAAACYVAAQEYYDNATSGTWTFDTQTTGTGLSGTTFATGSISTATNNQPVVGCTSTYNGQTFTPNNGFTAVGTPPSSDGMFDQFLAAAGAITFSISGTTTTTWTANVMTFTFTPTSGPTAAQQIGIFDQQLIGSTIIGRVDA